MSGRKKRTFGRKKNPSVEFLSFFPSFFLLSLSFSHSLLRFLPQICKMRRCERLTSLKPLKKPNVSTTTKKNVKFITFFLTMMHSCFFNTTDRWTWQGKGRSSFFFFLITPQVLERQQLLFFFFLRQGLSLLGCAPNQYWHHYRATSTSAMPG